MNLRRAVLMKMNCRGTWPDIGAIVYAGNRVDGVLPQKPFFCGESDGFAEGLFEFDFIETDGAIDVKNDAAGILADRLRLLFCQVNVLLDDLHRRLRDRALLLAFERGKNRSLDIIRNLR